MFEIVGLSGAQIIILELCFRFFPRRDLDLIISRRHLLVEDAAERAGFILFEIFDRVGRNEAFAEPGV